MSYLHHHTHAGQRASAAIGVGAFHVLLALGLAAGLSVKAYIEEEEKNLPANTFDIPPPPEPEQIVEPDPVVSPSNPPQTAPKPDISLTQVQPDVVIFEPGPISDELVLIPRPADPGPPAPPAPPPTPLARFDPVAAAPSNGPIGWITNNDYPGVSLRRGEEGSASYSVSVGTDGKVKDCRVTRSTGFARLDEATCRFVTRRAKFNPAKDSRGATVSGTYSGQVTWRIPE